MEPDKILDEIKAEVGKTATEIKGLLDTQGGELKTIKQSTDATGKRIDVADDRLKQLEADREGYKALTDQNKRLQDRLDELELKSQRGALGYGGGVSDAERAEMKSLGEKFVELIDGNRDRFKEAYKNRSFMGTPVAEAKSFFYGPDGMDSGRLAQMGIRASEVLGRKALVTTETANFSPTYIRPGIVPISSRELRMRDLMPVIPTTFNNIRYLRELGFSPAAALSLTGITTASTVATATAAAAHGLKVYDLVLIIGATVAAFNGPMRVTSVPSTTTFTYTIADQSNASASGTLTYVHLNHWGAAAAVAELGLKPEAKMRFLEVTGLVEVIAHYLKASNQVLDDLPALRNRIDNALIQGLRRREEDYLLYGNGTSPQIQGIMNLAGIMTYAQSQGPTNSGDTELDAIRRAITISQIMEGEAPTGGVMHPLIWERIELLKASTRQYILSTSPIPGAAVNAPPAVWRTPFVVTPAIIYTESIWGPWATQSELYDRQTASVRLADQNEDDFLYNRVTLRAEERVMSAWLKPESFCKVQFDGEPATS